MIGPMYKTGGEIFDILQWVKKNLGLEYRPAGSSLKTGETYRHITYAFSWFMNKKCEFVYIIRDLDTGNKKEEEKKMTKEEALKKIEELKTFVEKLDEEIPEMPEVFIDTPNAVELRAHTTEAGIRRNMDINFNDNNTKECYMIKAFELGYLMYSRECLSVDPCGEYVSLSDTVWKLYYDTTLDMYQLSQYGIGHIKPLVDATDPWSFKDKDTALKVMNYMNKYVKDKVKELY